MRWSAVSAVFALMLALGCAGVRAHTDFDPNARFDTYRSYSWVENEPVAPGSSRIADPLLLRRIRSSIDSQLQAKGYRTAADPARADFGVSFTVGSREKVQVTSSPSSAGWYGGWYATSNVSARTYTEGTLAIDVFDVDEHEAVWHGWASKRLSEGMDREKVVDEVVSAILAKFPPQR